MMMERFVSHGHSSFVTGVAFSSDGKRLTSASMGGTVQVYALDIRDLLELGRKRITRELTSEDCER